jgi:hypothetical protein
MYAANEKVFAVRNPASSRWLCQPCSAGGNSPVFSLIFEHVLALVLAVSAVNCRENLLYQGIFGLWPSDR